MKKLALFCLLFSPLMMSAQNHCVGAAFQMCTNYFVTPTTTFADNLPYAKTHNVWHLKIGTPALAGFVSGYDAITPVPKHYGWTSAGAVWEYVDPSSASNPNTWVQHPELGTAVKGLAIAGGTLYSNQTTTYCSGFGSNYRGIFKWTGSAWTQPATNSCETDFSAAGDGTLMKVSSGNVYYSKDDGVTWIHSDITPTGTNYIRPASVYSAIIVKSIPSGSVWRLTPSTGATTSLPGVTTNHPPAVDQDGNVYVIGTDSFVYHLNSAGTWDKLLGSGYTSISTCGKFCTYAQTASSLYQLPDLSMSYKVNLAGNTTCTPNCPPGSAYHTGHATSKFKHASLTGGQTVNGQPVNPTAEIGPLNALDTTSDPIFCFENPNDCVDPTSGGIITCSVVGGIFSGSTENPGFHIVRAETRQNDGFHGSIGGETFPECGPIGPKKCAYNAYKACKYTQFTYYCINGTQTPDYKENYITDCATSADGHSEPPGLWGFDTKALCSFYNNYKIGCIQASQDPLYAVQEPFGTPGPCTFNQVPQW